MAKDTYYFSHDFNSRSDVKIKRLMARHGMRGYGIFWAVVEDLYNNANALPTDYESIAFDLREDVKVVESVIKDFELFVIDNKVFGSSSVERRLNVRNEKSAKASESAKLRWSIERTQSGTNANALPSQSNSNAIKERKGKEKKEKEIKEKEILPFGSQEFLTAWNDFVVSRNQMKPKPTAKALELALNKLTPWGEQKAIIALKESAERGWKSVFEPDEKKMAERGVPLKNEFSDLMGYNATKHNDTDNYTFRISPGGKAIDYFRK